MSPIDAYQQLPDIGPTARAMEAFDPRRILVHVARVHGLSLSEYTRKRTPWSYSSLNQELSGTISPTLRRLAVHYVSANVGTPFGLDFVADYAHDGTEAARNFFSELPEGEQDRVLAHWEEKRMGPILPWRTWVSSMVRKRKNWLTKHEQHLTDLEVTMSPELGSLAVGASARIRAVMADQIKREPELLELVEHSHKDPSGDVWASVQLQPAVTEESEGLGESLEDTGTIETWIEEEESA